MHGNIRIAPLHGTPSGLVDGDADGGYGAGNERGYCRACLARDDDARWMMTPGDDDLPGSDGRGGRPVSWSASVVYARLIDEASNLGAQPWLQWLLGHVGHAATSWCWC